MAKSTARKKPTPSPEPTSAGDPAARIAQIDADLLKLLQQRAEIIADAVRPAANEADPSPALAAEPGSLTALIESDRGPLSQRIVRSIFREIQSGCRSLVRQTRIAFLGPLYSYSHLAAIHRFGRSVQFVPVGTISAVFEEVHQGHADFGLVPVENSTDGRIADTLDDVHPAAGADLRPGGDVHPPFAAGEVFAGGGERGLQPAAGDQPVPELAGQAPARRPGPSRSPAPRRPPNWPAKSRGRRPSPVRRRGSNTA